MSEEEMNILNKLEQIKINVEGKLYNFEAAKILCLINKLQKENEKERNKNKQLSNSIIKIYKEQDNLQARLDRKRAEIKQKDKQIKDLQLRKDSQEKRFKKYKENIEKKHEEIYENLVAENERKDKQIDLMAENITLFKSAAEKDGYSGAKIVSLGKEEIKEYFEKQAKEKGGY